MMIFNELQRRHYKRSECREGESLMSEANRTRRGGQIKKKGWLKPSPIIIIFHSSLFIFHLTYCFKNAFE
jgi:hypothetical protein